jgi:hypothetical protein
LFVALSGVEYQRKHGQRSVQRRLREKNSSKHVKKAVIYNDKTGRAISYKAMVGLRSKFENRKARRNGEVMTS